MPEKRETKRDWIATGTVELRGVTFFINDCTREEAEERAKRGDYDDYETNCAETYNWDIKSGSIEANE